MIIVEDFWRRNTFSYTDKLRRTQLEWPRIKFDINLQLKFENWNCRWCSIFFKALNFDRRQRILTFEYSVLCDQITPDTIRMTTNQFWQCFEAKFGKIQCLSYKKTIFIIMCFPKLPSKKLWKLSPKWSWHESL